MLDQTADLSGLQRARGAVRLGFGPGNRLRGLYQSGCLKAMLPRVEGGRPEAVLLNTAGGLTGGDRLSLEVTVDDAELAVTTQAAERCYRAATSEARVSVTLTLTGAAVLHWMPQETILFEGAALSRTIHAEMPAEATLLLAETVILGRWASGERLSRFALSDRWQVRRAGRLCHLEALKMQGGLADLAGPAVLMGGRAFASLLLIGPQAEALRDPLRRLDLPEGVSAGFSAWDGKLAARLIAVDPRGLRRAMGDVLHHMTGRPLPRVWTM